MATPTAQLRCPICKRVVEEGSTARPFCSERCRTIDLAQWLGGAYRIPGPPVDPGQTPERDDEETG